MQKWRKLALAVLALIGALMIYASVNLSPLPERGSTATSDGTVTWTRR